MSSRRRVAVVTGAGRGIGRGIARMLAERGYDLGLSARTEAELHAAAREFEGLGCRSVVVPGDATDERVAAQLLERAGRELGPVEVAVAAAGQARSKLLVETTPDELLGLLRVNVLGVHNVVRAAAQAMIAEQTKGRIVVIASIASLRGMRFTSAYSASKHAVLGLVRSAALELARSGITVNAICPGWVATQMFEETLDNIVEKTGRSRDEARAAIEGRIPLGRVSTVEDVAATVRWVVDAPQVTGQAIVVDGGETL